MLIITGTIAYDYIMDFPGLFADHILPAQIHKINLSFIVSKFEKRRGGTAGNVSYNLALLGVKNILLSAAGKDFKEYKMEFENLGINTRHVFTDKSMYTATGFAMTDKSDNQIWGYFYGAAGRINELKISEVATKDDLVLIGPSGAKGSMSFVKQCINAKIPYMFDPGFILTQVSDDDLILGVSNAKYVIGNDYEISVIKKRIKTFPDTIVITTLGEKGALIQANGKECHIAPVKPLKLIDPTGAGDAWRAGFLCGIANNHDLGTCGKIGSLTSSFALEAYGTQEHKFTKQQFLDRYNRNYSGSINL